MANRLQLKRGTTTPGTIFYEGEPIYDKTGRVLYVGNSGGTGTGAGSTIASAATYDAAREILFPASSSGPGNIRLYENTDNGTNYVSVAAATLIASNYTLTLPNGTGSDGQVLKTDGSGVLDWVDQTSGFSGFTISDSTNTSSITDNNTITFSGGTGITAAVTQDGDAIAYTLDTELQALSSVTSAADKVPYFTGSGTAAVADLSSFGRTLIDDADAAAARTTLGVDAAGTDNSTDVTLVTTTADYLSITGQAITLNQIDLTTDVTGDLPVTEGGTGASDAATARTNLGVDAAGTDNSTDVTLVTTTADYLSITGQAITLNQIDLTTDVTGDLPVTEGGTGASDAATARTNLGVDAAGTDNSTDVTLVTTTADYLSITGQAITLNQIDLTTDVTGDLPITEGGTGASDAATARTNLGVDEAGTDNSTDVTLVTTSHDYLSISGQAITLGAIDLAADVTGSLPNSNLANNSITVSDGTTSTATALGETITFSGTPNEVEVSESNGTITVGLPDDVTIGGSLTVTQNLNVLGTAVTFSVETTRVEDRILELGLVDGAAPSATTTWDTGVAFNYFQTSAKKSGVVWLDNTFMAMLSELSETSDSGNADPQITATSYAPIAAGGLYVGGIASGNEVINSSQAAVNLIFDGGTY